MVQSDSATVSDRARPWSGCIGIIVNQNRFPAHQETCRVISAVQVQLPIPGIFLPFKRIVPPFKLVLRFASRPNSLSVGGNCLFLEEQF
eukprot:4093431-Pleurochrysis_carterae.AAC.2